MIACRIHLYRRKCRVYVYSENCSSGRRLGGHGVAGAEQQRYGKSQNRERVLQAIKESNYQPNLLARQLRTARSNMITVMVSNIANPFCAEVVKGIEEEAEKNGYRILLCNSGSDLARSTSGLQLLSGKMVDGIITMNALSSLPELTTMIGDAPRVQCAGMPTPAASPASGLTTLRRLRGGIPVGR